MRYDHKSLSSHLEIQVSPARCVNDDSGLLRKVDCEIPHWLERRMKHFL